MGARPRSGRVLQALALAGAGQALHEHRQQIIQSEKHSTAPTSERTATR